MNHHHSHDAGERGALQWRDWMFLGAAGFLGAHAVISNFGEVRQGTSSVFDWLAIMAGIVLVLHVVMSLVRRAG